MLSTLITWCCPPLCCTLGTHTHTHIYTVSWCKRLSFALFTVRCVWVTSEPICVYRILFLTPSHLCFLLILLSLLLCLFLSLVRFMSLLLILYSLFVLFFSCGLFVHSFVLTVCVIVYVCVFLCVVVFCF